MGLNSSKYPTLGEPVPTAGPSSHPIACDLVDQVEAELLVSALDARWWYGTQKCSSGICSPSIITSKVPTQQAPIFGQDDELLGPCGVVSALAEIAPAIRGYSVESSSKRPVQQPLPMLRCLSAPLIIKDPPVAAKPRTKAEPAVPKDDLQRCKGPAPCSNSSEHWCTEGFSPDLNSAATSPAVRMAAAKTAAGPDTWVAPLPAAPATAVLTVQQLSFGSDPLPLHLLCMEVQQRRAQQQEQRRLRQQTLRMGAQLEPARIIQGWKVEGGVAQLTSSSKRTTEKPGLSLARLSPGVTL